MSLYQCGLLEAVRGIAAAQFSPAEYLESCIGRTLAVEPRIAAFAHFDAHAARVQLAALPAGLPLAGAPIGVKDIISTRGMPTEMGSRAYRGHIPQQSARAVMALERAGGLVFGKTVTTELAWRNAGATRNPWQADHTPGGSSSGSAAAVAAGCVPAALGTQTLGSVIRPAAFCGIVGYKPSFGMIPRAGVHPLAASLDHVGVMTRCVEDAAFLVSLLAGRDDAAFAAGAVAAGAVATSIWPLLGCPRRPRIALLRTSIWPRVEAEQREAVEHASACLATGGADVTELVLPPAFDAIWSLADIVCAAEAAAVNGPLADEVPPRIGPAMRELVARGRTIPAPEYVHALHAQRALITAFANLMVPFDAVLAAPALGGAPKGLDATGDAVLCTPFSVLGAPAITLPVARSAAGLPLAIQLASPWGSDQRLLSIAAWAESMLGWRTSFPPF